MNLALLTSTTKAQALTCQAIRPSASEAAWSHAAYAVSFSLFGGHQNPGARMLTVAPSLCPSLDRSIKQEGQP